MVEQAVRPDFVVGSSLGAINAAAYAGVPDARGVQRLAAIWRGLRREDVFPVAPLKGLLGFAGLSKSLLDPASLRALLTRELPYERLEDARVPCRVVATDVLSGGEVVLSSGPVVEIDGQHLIDGGMSSNTPISTAIAQGAERIVVLPTGFACALEKPPAGAMAMVLHALTLLIARQLVIERAAASTRSWLDAGGLERPNLPHELTPHSHDAL